MRGLKVTGAALAALVAVAVLPASAQTPSPAGAAVYIISPKDKASVKSPFKVQFGLTGMGVAPAGIDKEKTGHHHLIIDATVTPDEMKAPLVADGKHVHFGAGQTEAMVTLPKGKHTLQLVVGDQNHIPHNPAVISQVITVNVK